MAIKRSSIFCNRINTLIVGFIILFVIIGEFFFSLKQPMNNLGFSFKFYEPYILINKVVDNTAAEESGIYKNQFINSINYFTYSDFVNYRKSVDEETYKNHFSTFFNFNDILSVEDFDGSIVTYKIQQLSFIQQVKSLSTFSKIKFIISLVMMLCSFYICFLSDSDESLYPLIYCIFFISLATVNIFDSEFSSPVYSKTVSVLLDIGLYLLFTSLFEYFSQIFKRLKKINLFSHIKYIPVCILIIKYIHILIYKWNLVDNPFYRINSIFVSTICLVLLGIFLYVVFTFPKALSVTFKFFLLGFVFAVIPLLFNHFVFLFKHSIFMTERDRIVSTFAFVFLPFMLILAILQNKNLIKTQRTAWIVTYIGYIALTFPIFFTIYDHISNINLEPFTIIYTLLTPVYFAIIYRLILSFYSINTEDDKRKLSEFMQLITPITDTYHLHEVTTQEIVKLLDCSYIFYYKLTDNKWENLYTWGNISSELEKEKFAESNTKISVSFYKDGSFSIPIVRDNKTTGVIYIGPKKNSDFYLPGEHQLIVEMIKGFHNHYLMYTNNKLIKELKFKNNKMIEIQDNTILSMANLIESRDGGTGAHVKRTAEYSVLIAKRAMEKGLYKNELNKEFIDLIYKSAPMHDIGKIIVSDSVLKKPGKLTTEEFEEMKLHTTEGERIVQEVLSNSEDDKYISMTSKIAMYHHEKWNGKGYPSGLSENNIPLCARILAIADVFDALVSPRCYKEPMEPEKAFSIIQEDSGTHFDPLLTQVFLELKDEALEIMRHEYL